MSRSLDLVLRHGPANPALVRLEQPAHQIDSAGLFASSIVFVRFSAAA
jgi:hypothetical protein